MKKNLLIIAELVLSVIVLAVLTNLIADFVALPLWLVLVIGLIAFAALIAVTFSLLRQPTEPTPSLSAPNQAPPSLREFVGRSGELRKITRQLKPATKIAITGLVGMGGLGKTELAKLAASRVARRFRDGVLWADCAEQDLISIADQWAAAYGIQLPGDDPASKAAAWRGLISAKEALLIFDNLQPRQDLEPLFPPSGRSAVLITTRHGNHPDLRGAGRLDLDHFTPDEASDLAREILGKDQARDQAADATHLFELLGYLPLAISVALHHANKCGWSLTALNAKLEAAGALTILGDEEALKRSLNATFQAAWDNLGDLQEPFRTLFLFNQGPSFSTQALADTLDLDPNDAGALLHRLAGRSLLSKETEGRWSLHPLLREFVDTLDPPDHAAHLRMARHYEQVAREATRLYNQGGEDVLQALVLFDLEWPHIRAGQAWAAAHAAADDEAAYLCSDYAYNSTPLLLLRLPASDRIAWLEPALRAARHVGHSEAGGWHLGNLGLAYADKGEWDRAIEFYEQALETLEQAGNIHGMAIAFNNLGLVYTDKGDWDRAIDFYEQSLAAKEQVGNIRGKAATYGNLGLVYAHKREWGRAIRYHEKDLEISEQVGDIHGMAQAYGNLGLAYVAIGEWDRTLEYYEQALETLEQVGDIHGMAQTYNNLGAVHQRKGELDRAIELHEQALEIFRQIGARRGEGECQGNLGLAYRDLSNTARAREYLTQALAIYEDIGDPRAADVCRDLAALDD